MQKLLINKNRFMKRLYVNNAILLTLLIFLVSILIIVVSYLINLSFFKNHTFFNDPVSYHLYNIKLYEYAIQHSFLETILFDITHNSKCLIRTLPLIFHPELLKYKYSFLLTTIPIFLLFIFTLFNALIKTLSNKLLVFGLIMFFLSANVLISPWYGLSVYWLDLTAGFALGSAIIHLIFWVKETKNKHLYANIAFCFIAFLARDRIFIFYSILSLPIYLYAFFRLWKDKNKVMQLLILYIFILFPIVIRDILFVSDQMKANYSYGLSQGIVKSFGTFSSAFINKFLSKSYIIVQLIIFVILLLSSEKEPIKKFFLRIGLVFYTIFAIPFFMIFILESTEAVHVYLIGITAIFFYPLFLKVKDYNYHKYLGLVLIFYSVFNFCSSYDKYQWKNINPHPYYKDSKLIADLIEKKITKSKMRWMGFHDENYLVPNVQTFYQKGFFPEEIDRKLFFSIHQSYLISAYNITDKFLMAKYFKDNIQFFDLLVIPDSSKIDELFDNEYSKKISREVSNYVANNESWTIDTSLNTRSFGKIKLYVRVNETCQK